jgi:Tol biopolymer transport system component
VLVAVGAAALAGAQPLVTRVSVATGGTQGEAGSGLRALSADGRYVAFASESPNLVTGDTNRAVDVFVRDRQAGTTTRVSLSDAGAEGDCDSTTVAISATGRFVAFNSSASNLVAGHTNGATDVFLRDRDTDVDGIFDEVGAVSTTRISVATSGQQVDESSTIAKPSAISADGRYVVFQSWAESLVPGAVGYDLHVYVRDTALATTTRLSVATDGTPGNSDSGFPTISSSGRFVAFTSGASNLVAGDTNDRNACHGARVPGNTDPPLWNCYDVFVRDRDIDNDGIFDEPGAVATSRVSVASDGTQGDDESGIAAISGDGRYVAFHSAASNLVPGDTNDTDDLFVRDRQTGTTTRLAMVAFGPDRETALFEMDLGISADGRVVVFLSRASTVVPGDTNGAADVFAYDGVAGTTRRQPLPRRRGSRRRQPHPRHFGGRHRGRVDVGSDEPRARRYERRVGRLCRCGGPHRREGHRQGRPAGLVGAALGPEERLGCR